MFDNQVLTDPRLALDTVHDGRHQLRAEPRARESVPYLLSLPEHGIALFTYTWVNHAGEAGAVLAVFGPGVGPQPIVEALPDRPVPADMDFSDWQLGGLRLAQDLRFDRAQVRWKSDRVDLELDFEAFHPPYAYGRDERGCMRYAADDRIEQGGRASGRLRLGERVIAFDTTGHRDHSWGTRDWQVFQHYKWVHAQAGADLALHFWLVEALGRTELRGYVHKEGRMSVVTDVRFHCSYAGALDPQRWSATLTDAAGRTTTVDAEVYARFRLYPDPACCLNESAGSAMIDGRPGVAWLEVCFPEAYRRHIAEVGLY